MRETTEVVATKFTPQVPAGVLSDVEVDVEEGVEIEPPPQPAKEILATVRAVLLAPKLWKWVRLPSPVPDFEAVTL